MAQKPAHENQDEQAGKPSGTRKRIDPERLRKAGFPEELIKEAVAREESGVLNHRAPDDLVQRTIEACQEAINAASPEAIKKARDSATKKPSR